jgi:uncharacterized protein YicC (UPF0701 family)
MASLKEVERALEEFLDAAAEKAQQDAKNGVIDLDDILSIKPDDEDVEMIDEAYVEELRKVVQQQMRTKEGARRLFVAIGFAIRQVGRLT